MAMELITTVTVDAPIDAAWDLMVDPERAGRCLPGLVSWETVTPRQTFRLLMAPMESPGGVRIPVLIEWRRLSPVALLELQAHLRLGSTTLLVDGLVELRTVSALPARTELALTARLEPPNPLLAQMIQNAAPRLLAAFFRCVKAELAAG